MADFNFLPPQIQLFGGQNTAWEPLGQESQLKPYQQDMGYDLYSKVFSGFDADRFKVSLTSDPDRMKQAEQLFTQIDSMQFKGISQFDPMQNGWTSPGWGQDNGMGFGAPALGAGSVNPALSGNPNLIAQRESDFQAVANTSRYDNSSMGWSNSGPTAPPNWGSNFPSVSIGGSSLDVGGMSPDIQRQIFAQMGGAGGGDSVSQATDAISKLGKALKDDLIPATKDYNDQVSQTVGAMKDRDTSGGGFGNWGGGGSDFGTWNGGDNNWGSGGIRPEVMDRYGFGKDMPKFDDIDTSSSNPFSDWASQTFAPSHLMRGFRGANLANRLFTQPAFAAADQYRDQMAGQDASMLQSGMIGYSDAMSGQYGQLMRRNTNAQERQFAFGQQVDAAYGGFADLALGPSAANGPLGAAAGVLAPAVGMGLGAASLFGGPAGLAVGAGMALAGTAGYVSSSMKDYQDIGNFQNSGMTLQALGQNFEGGIGQIAGRIGHDLGVVSDDRYSKIMNSGQFAGDVNMYSNGNMSRQQLTTQAKSLGFSAAEALDAGQQTFFENAASKYGINRDQTANMLGFYQRYNPNQMPSGQQFDQMAELTARGFNMNSLNGIAAGQNMNPLDQDQMSQLQQQIGNYAMSLPEGTNLGLLGDQLSATGKQLAPANALRLQAGLPKLSPLAYQSELYQRNPALQDSMTGLYNAAAGDALQSSSYYNQVVTKVAPVIQGEMEAGAMRPNEAWHNPFAARMQGAMQANESRWMQAEVYGGANSALASAMQWDTALPQDQQNKVNAIGSGDRLALSQNWQALGDIRYQTMNTTTGMASMYGGMSKDWYSAMQQDQGGLFRLSYDQASGGTKGMEDHLRDEGRALEQYQYNQQTTSRNIGYQTSTGGASGINTQGFAVGGDGLANLSQLFQSQGMTFNPGNGMGQWQLQDAGVALSREQQQWQMNQSGQSINLQAQNMALSNQQWNESFAMNQQQFNLSTNYQSQSMNIQRGQQVQQEGWQSQDLAMSRNKMELNYGWQQEDFDRNIRFSRGRDRVDLERQQERAAITHSMDETQQGNAESRNKTETQWNKEEFDRKKQYFDQTTTLSQQEMDMNKRHHEEKMQLDNQSFALTQQNHEKEKQWMTQQWGLEDQRRVLDRQNEEMQFKMSTDMAIAVKKVNDDSNLYKDALTAIDREYTQNNAQIELATKNMSLWTAAVQAFNGQTPSSVFQGSSTPSAPYTSGQHIPSGGVGGGGGAITASHAMNGGNDVVVQLLGQMAEHIKQMALGGLVQATIYPSGNAPISVGDLRSQASARFKSKR